MCTEKNIKLSLDQARKMYGKNPEMDDLLLAIFSKEELIKKKLPELFRDLTVTPGYYITSQGRIDRSSELGAYKNSFATEKQAKSALAAAQLSQLMAVYNDGWEQPSPDYRVIRYYIILLSGKITESASPDSYHFLTFKTAELRDEFLKNFESLIKEYFMID